MKPGSIIEIPLPDGKFSYACIFAGLIIGVYKIESPKKLKINEVILNNIQIYASLNRSFKKIFPVIGKINLEDTYPPELAWYAEWLPEDSVKRSAIRNKQGKTVNVTRKHFISLVKKGLILSVFNKPDYFPAWLAENLNDWPNYKMPE